MATSDTTAPVLYQHEDGRYGIAPTAELATFTRGDPGWHRVGPVDVVEHASDQASVKVSGYPWDVPTDPERVAAAARLVSDAVSAVADLDTLRHQVVCEPINVMGAFLGTAGIAFQTIGRNLDDAAEILGCARIGSFDEMPKGESV